jgi:hypothetical protein
MAVQKTNAWFSVKSIDVALLGLVLVLALVGGLLLWLSPRWWSDYLTMLDVRYWPPWKSIGLGIAAMQSLLVIRHWPNKKQ